VSRAWRHKLKLKDLLGEDTSHQATAEAAVEMHKRLEEFRFAWFPDDDEIEAISDEFHTIGYVDGPAGKASADEFNGVMHMLYDWADTDRRLWID
jgi:hypothetical protein